MSTPVGPLGSGLGGGVELTLYNIVKILQKRGHRVQVVAPAQSFLAEIPLTEIAGNLQISAQHQTEDSPICMPENSVIGNMWDYARQVQSEYDLIVNFAYDWLPFYLTPFFNCPVAHFVTMGSLTKAMDLIIKQIGHQYPHLLGFCTKAQADTFGLADCCDCLGSPVDFSLYEFCANPDDYLAWSGRISPEKGLEDAVAAAQITGIPLKIFGKIQVQDYWEKICQDYPDAPFEYLGFFPINELQQLLRKSFALIMTPRWVEAFGNVAIEALACGVPVISYRRGGPSEIIKHGKTGFLVEPDDVMGLVSAIRDLPQINRYDCRHLTEQEYSLDKIGDRFENWLKRIVC